MSFILVDDASGADSLRTELRGAARLALDCEAAGFHRYSDRLCLVQVSTGTADYVLDTLAYDFGEALRPSLEAPHVEVVVHGADYDLRLLDRDLGIHPVGLFDTQVAAALSGEPSLGLASLLEKHLGVQVSKKYQRADWARRPLPNDMLEYASTDTRYLLGLADVLAEGLEALGRAAWAEAECRELETIRWEEDDTDPVVRVRGARDLEARDVTALREALGWRDEVARRKDRAPFRVAGDGPLLEVVRRRPESLDALSGIGGLNGHLVRTEGRALLDRLRKVEALADSELKPYPARRTNGRGRPPVEVEALAERLKQARNRRARTLGLDRGVLLANGVINEIAWNQPTSADALVAVPGVKRWQVEAVGEDLLEVLGPQSRHPSTAGGG